MIESVLQLCILIVCHHSLREGPKWSKSGPYGKFARLGCACADNTKSSSARFMRKQQVQIKKIGVLIMASFTWELGHPRPRFQGKPGKSSPLAPPRPACAPYNALALESRGRRICSTCHHLSLALCPPIFYDVTWAAWCGFEWNKNIRKNMNRIRMEFVNKHELRDLNAFTEWAKVFIRIQKIIETQNYFFLICVQMSVICTPNRAETQGYTDCSQRIFVCT